MRIFSDYPISAQIGFQDPGTQNLLGIFDQYDRICFYQIIILVVVMWFYISSIYYSSPLMISFAHGNLIEFLWTLAPAGILWAIGLPSLKLLYMQDEILDSEITLKIIGNQWYWSYEYSDYDDTLAFDSFLVDDQSLELGDLRLLTTDNSQVLPVQTSIRLLITSNDVIHSFGVPSLGLKCDAIPGRLNSVGQMIQRESHYYGQCSELCGSLHYAMPISIQAVSLPNYFTFQASL